MHIQDIRYIARNMGLRTGRITKKELILSVQAQEGNFPCFATAADGICNQDRCLWREECFMHAKSK